MTIFAVGTSHSVASSSVRELLHVDLNEAFAALTRLIDRGIVSEAVPLSTCARLELYAVTDHPAMAQRTVLNLLSRKSRLPRAELGRHLYALSGPAAVRHLLRVAGGLDSVIYGEAEVLGQIRDAAHDPRGETLRGPVLHRLFETALATGKRARSETGIGRGTVSIASAAVDMLRDRIGSLKGMRAVVLGAGDTGSAVARLLRKGRVQRLLVANRTYAAARALADELGAEAADLGRLGELLPDADIVVGAVAGSEPILGVAELTGALRGRSAASGPMHLLDLGHPRNFDPEIESLGGVVVQTLSAVFDRVAEAGAARQEHGPLVEAIIREEVGGYLTWLRSRPSVAVLRAVRDRAMELARVEADRFSRGSEGEDRERLRALATAVARSLLHSPTVALRDADPSTLEGRWLVESAATLFATRGRAMAVGPE